MASMQPSEFDSDFNRATDPQTLAGQAIRLPSKWQVVKRCCSFFDRLTQQRPKKLFLAPKNSSDCISPRHPVRSMESAPAGAEYFGPTNTRQEGLVGWEIGKHLAKRTVGAVCLREGQNAPDVRFALSV